MRYFESTSLENNILTSAIDIFASLLLAGLLLVSCSSRTATQSPPVHIPQDFSEAGTTQVPDRWWTVFDDVTLDSLVTQSLQQNFTLKTAWYRLHEAQAIANRTSSSLVPWLDAFGEGSVTQTKSGTNEQLRLGLTSEYELDLWGGIQSEAQAAELRAEATRADYQAAAISLSAEVVRSWFQLLEAQNQLSLLQQQIKTNEKALEILRTRFNSGQIRIADILRQRQLLESTREQKIAAESRIQVLEHQLVVLLGQPPQRPIEYSSREMPALPPLPETGVPMEVVERRPDIRQAFYRVQAADREVAVAIRNQYPRLTLTASVSTTENAAQNLFDEWISSFTGNLLAPLFHAGELRAAADQAEAAKNQRIAEYAQTVLTAFQEVENALIREKKQAQRVASLEEQVRLAGQTYERLRQEYFNGVGAYLDVLTALTEEQALRRNLLSARLTLIEYRIALYRALAGGFETKRESSNTS